MKFSFYAYLRTTLSEQIHSRHWPAPINFWRYAEKIRRRAVTEKTLHY